MVDQEQTQTPSSPVVTEPAPQQEEQRPESLRDTLSKAMDEHFGADSEISRPGGDEKPPAAAPPGERQVVLERGPDGKFKRPGAPAPQAKPPTVRPGERREAVPAPAAAAKPGRATETQPVTEPPPDPTAKAPQAWKALAREHWKDLDKLPPEAAKVIKAELLQREREVNERLSRDSSSMREHQQYRSVIAPFENTIRARGHEPLAVVQNLLRTATALESANPWNRAVVAASIIRGAGVDVQMLADALDGAQQPGAPAGRPPGEARDPRVDQLIEETRARDAELRERLRQQDEQEVAQLRRGYEEFAKTHDFYEDVKADMARIIRWKASEGLDIPDEEAYQMAVNLHPDLAQIQRQREEERAASDPESPTRRAERAAGSLRPTAVVTDQGGVDPRNLRATISAAYDKHLGRA